MLTRANTVTIPIFEAQHVFAMNLMSQTDKTLGRIMCLMARPSSKCRHRDWRAALPLALCNIRLYCVYRSLLLATAVKRTPVQIVDTDSTDTYAAQLVDIDGTATCTGQLVDADCTVTCTGPLLPNMRRLVIAGDGPFSDIFRTILVYYERPYCTNVRILPGFQVNNQAGVSFAAVNIAEDCISLLLETARHNPQLRELFVKEPPSKLSEDFWKCVAQAWGSCLQNLHIDDTFCAFFETSLADIAQIKSLRRLRIISQSVRNIYPLAILSQLRVLILSHCLVDDSTLAPVLPSLQQLRELDVSDTLVTPVIMCVLPPTLNTLKAGDQTRYRSNGPAALPSCSCFRHFSEPGKHDSNCVNSGSAGAIASRKHTSEVQFLDHRKLCGLRRLEWGSWAVMQQGILSVENMLPSLRKLSVYGADYNDEVANAILAGQHLMYLFFWACDVSDKTARAVSQLPALKYVSFNNCPLVTREGKLAIARGVAAQSNVLKAVRFGTETQTPSQINAEAG